MVVMVGVALNIVLMITAITVLSLPLSLSLQIAVGLNLLPSLLVTGMGTGIWYWQEPPTWYDRQNF